jgi:hypothetical protein
MLVKFFSGPKAPPRIGRRKLSEPSIARCERQMRLFSKNPAAGRPSRAVSDVQPRTAAMQKR